MLDKMAFFVYVIRSGSISSAARKFNISVSAGSRWLQELEQNSAARSWSNRCSVQGAMGQRSQP